MATWVEIVRPQIVIASAIGKFRVTHEAAAEPHGTAEPSGVRTAAAVELERIGREARRASAVPGVAAEAEAGAVVGVDAAELFTISPIRRIIWKNR